MECPKCHVIGNLAFSGPGVHPDLNLKCQCGYTGKASTFDSDLKAMPVQLEEVQAERGNVYGSFADHSKAVDDIMKILSNINYRKNPGQVKYPKGFKTALFYMVSKLVRLATTPTHIDSALDLSSYADLWLKIINPEKGTEDEKSN